MFKFDTGYRKDFKTEEAFLRDVFQRNINKIPAGVNKEMLVLQVKSYKVEYNTNITGALRKLAKSDEYKNKIRINIRNSPKRIEVTYIR